MGEDTVYVVCGTNWEYNDEYNYPLEGVTICSVHQSKAGAEAEAQKLNRSFVRGLDFNSYDSDTIQYLFDNLSPQERRIVARIAGADGGDVDYEDFASYKFPLEISDMDADMLVRLFGATLRTACVEPYSLGK